MPRSAVSNAVAAGLVVAVIISAGIASFLATSPPPQRIVTIPGAVKQVTVPGPERVTTTSVTQTFLPTPEFLLSELIEGAKKEGKLVLYTQQSPATVEKEIALFKKRYPFMEVEFIRGPTTTLIDRIVAEVRGGRFLFDVVWSSLGGFAALREQGVEFAKFERVADNYIPAEYRVVRKFEGIIHLDRYLIFSMGYNTKLVGGGDVTRYQDLADPRWQGKLGIPNPLTHITTTEWFITMKDVIGPAWSSWVQGIVNNNPKFYISLTPVAKGIALGEVPFGLTLLHDIRLQKEAGHPLQPVIVDPMLIAVRGVAISQKPPHPFSAKLWAEFMIDRDLQNQVLEFGEIPLRRDVVAKGEASKFLALKTLPTPALTADDLKKGAEELKALGFK